MGTSYQKESAELSEAFDLLRLAADAAGEKIRNLENQVYDLKKENRGLQIKINAYELSESKKWDVVTQVRFRWFLPGEDDVCFEGEATVKLRGESGKQDEFGFSTDEGDSEALIHRCYKHDNGVVYSWQPYGNDYDWLLTSALERAAIDAYDNPPSLKIVFPGE